MATATTDFKPGTVVEWWTKDVPALSTQCHKIVKPLCANAGEVKRSEECSCAPLPTSPAVVAYRESQEYLESDQGKGRRKPLTAVPVVIGSIPSKQPIREEQPQRRQAKATQAKRTKQTQKRGR